MKIDLEQLYREIVNEYKGRGSESFVRQEFLEALAERGTAFLNTKKGHQNIPESRHDVEF